MTTTSRRFSNGQVFETIRGSDGSVTQRVLDAVNGRIEGQVEAAEKEPLSYFAGGGKVKLLGANSAIAPRGIQANANLGVGDPVQLNGGLVSATPGLGSTQAELEAIISEQQKAIARLRSLLIDEQNGAIESVQDGVYPIIPRVEIRSKVEDLFTSGSSAATATLSPAIGEILEVGDRLDLNISNADGQLLSFTIKLLRLL
ncbi:MAG: hypothetical protein F6J95_023495 [Leptolyngbya sp. SIO1E4]|nr:hypothetical protein [Leptolyngbya sp. SIO1E4]